MPEEILTLRLGDVVVLKKKHPCGSYEWTVSRLGADIGLVCLRCGRRQLMARSGAPYAGAVGQARAVLLKTSERQQKRRAVFR